MRLRSNKETVTVEWEEKMRYHNPKPSVLKLFYASLFLADHSMLPASFCPFLYDYNPPSPPQKELLVFLNIRSSRAQSALITQMQVSMILGPAEVKQNRYFRENWNMACVYTTLWLNLTPCDWLWESCPAVRDKYTSVTTTTACDVLHDISSSELFQDSGFVCHWATQAWMGPSPCPWQLPNVPGWSSIGYHQSPASCPTSLVLDPD